MVMKKVISLICICFVLHFSCNGQTYVSSIFNNKNGLLDNNVVKILIDKRGFLWIQTDRGLHVYDGNSLKVYPDYIEDFSEGHDGFIYATGRNCVYKYSPLKKIETLIPPGIIDLNYDKEKNAYRGIKKFITNEGDIVYHLGGVREAKDTIKVFRNSLIKKISLKHEGKKDIAYYFYIDNNSKLWVLISNDKTGEVELYLYENGELALFNNKIKCKEFPRSIFTNKKSEVFLFLPDEIHKISRFEQKSYKIPIEYNPFLRNQGTNMIESKDGAILLPCEHGLVRLLNDKVSLIKDSSYRTIMCDSLIQTSYDKNGKEIKNGIWACDSRSFGNCLLVDERDRIYTGNKIYANGTFSEVFKLEKGTSINGITLDHEGNIWYGTSKGVFRYKRVPINNLSKKYSVKDELVYVDNNSTLYTMWYSFSGNNILITNINILKYNAELDKYIKTDMISFKRITDPYGNNSDSRFIRVISSKGKILIFSEEFLYTYDGTIANKVDLDKLNYSLDKITDSYPDKNKIIKNSIFKDKEGFVWFYYRGNFIKTDGYIFNCFGKEAGILDTLAFSSNFNALSQPELNSYNLIFSWDYFYSLTNNTFKKFNYKENNLPSQGSLTSIFTNKSGAIYFFVDSLGNPNKKSSLLKFENNKFSQYSIINPENIQLKSVQFTSYRNFYILDLGQGVGFAKAQLNDTNRTITFAKLNFNPEYYTSNSNFKISDDKLFIFAESSPLLIFPLDSMSGNTGEPFIIQDYSVFQESPVTSNGKYYINNVGFDGEHENWILRINPRDKFFNEIEPITTILGLSYVSNDIKTERYTSLDGIEIPFDFNPFKIFFKGISYVEKGKVKYKYFLEGLDTKWNEINEDNIIYSSLSPGKYKFKVMACNNHGVWNIIPAEFSFTILPPWYRTWYSYCCYALAFIAGIRGYIRNRTKKLEKEKKKLEQTVEERTAEVVQQKHLIEEKHKEITDSIHYAKRIQTALLPTEKYIDRNLNDLQKNK